jgi:hypothetical protein
MFLEELTLKDIAQWFYFISPIQIWMDMVVNF